MGLPQEKPAVFDDLLVFENHDGQWLLLAVLEDDAAVSQPPFAAIRFALGGLWAD